RALERRPVRSRREARQTRHTQEIGGGSTCESRWRTVALAGTDRRHRRRVPRLPGGTSQGAGSAALTASLTHVHHRLNKNAGVLIRAHARSWVAVRRFRPSCLELSSTSCRSCTTTGSVGTALVARARSSS